MPDGWVRADAVPTPESLLDALRAAMRQECAGDDATARCTLRCIVEAAPGWAEPWFRLGQSLRRAGDRQAAADAYDTALGLEPCRVDGLIARGVLALQINDPEAGVELLRRAVALAPARDEAWHALGLGEARCERPTAAAAALHEAHRLEPERLLYAIDLADLLRLHPEAADPPLWPDGIGLALDGRLALHRKDFDAAEPALAAAQVLLPDEPWISGALGELYVLLNRPVEAVATLREASRLAPDDRAAAHNLGVALSRSYRYAESESVLTDALTRFGNDANTLTTRAAQRAAIGDLAEALADLDVARSISPANVTVERNACGLMPYIEDLGALEIRGAMEALSRLLGRPQVPLCSRRCGEGLHNEARNPDRTVRLGLLSNSLLVHPVGWLTSAAIEALDPTMFEIICFGLRKADDPFALRFNARAEEWQRTEGWSAQAIAEKIAEAEIDVLIDLGGYGDTGELPVLAYRPAPVQVKWVGMQATTTGLAEVDFFITDRWETPGGFERFYSERLLRLDDGYVCYTPPPGAAPVSPLPALANGHVTFGCFNNVMKITDGTLRLWAALFERVPAARMILRCPQFSEASNVERFLARAEAAGIAPAMLDLRGRAPHPKFIATYREVDIALDPFPYTGGLTTCEALFMGVPVVTLAGEIFAARHSASHLSNVGLADWVTTTQAAYLARALAAVADLDGLARLRAGLRAQVLASPLCDAPRFGRSLGRALRSAWAAYCRGELGR